MSSVGSMMGGLVSGVTNTLSDIGGFASDVYDGAKGLVDSPLASSALSGAANYVGGSDMNATNLQIARENNATAINLADTAHQREVADLRAAGLNPILSAGGSGASVPTMAAPTLSNALGEGMNHAISNFSALQSARQADAAVDQARATVNLNNALAAKAAADTTSSLAQARNIDADTSLKRTGVFGKTLGVDAAIAGQSLAVNASDLISDKIRDIVSGIHTSSAKKVTRSSVPSRNKGSLVPAPELGPHVERLQW